MNQKRCPITYQLLADEKKYSVDGLRLLSRHLNTLDHLSFTLEELRQEAASRSLKMSVQGVQPKLSAVLNIKKNCFDIVDSHGKFILKPSFGEYPEIAANEDLTMKLASVMGIEVPLHGLIYNRDDTFTYFIKRFDRVGHKDKVPVEDFAQLSGNTRDTKYQFSMEKLIPIIEKYCTFPVLEKHKLFTRILFNYLVGNEDMHLKNYSLITRRGKVELAPAYDFLNTTILLPHAKEEIALPLNGKKNNLTRKDLVDYYAYERLSLPPMLIEEVFDHFNKNLPALYDLIDISFLGRAMKDRYKDTVLQRSAIFLKRLLV